MDLLDRLAELMKSIFGDGGGAQRREGKPSFSDPDVSEAWEELDDYLGGRSAKTGGAGAGPRGGTGRADSGGARRTTAPGAADEDLRRDYANLEVPFGADIETVKRAYKTLIMRYHPDKFAGNPEKLRDATEITKKVNESFERIRSHTERRG